MNDRLPMTPSGFETLKNELKRLKSVDRPENIQDIEEALAHGDLSENAEYHAAMERKSHIDARIRFVDDRIARAQVIDPKSQSGDKILFGATVVLCDAETDGEVTYTLVGDDESDVKNGLLSYSSPVGRALIGKEATDEVTVKIPKGTRVYEVLEIRYE
jgi:transcription elongation factor GreA